MFPCKLWVEQGITPFSLLFVTTDPTSQTRFPKHDLHLLKTHVRVRLWETQDTVLNSSNNGTLYRYEMVRQTIAPINTTVDSSASQNDSVMRKQKKFEIGVSLKDKIIKAKTGSSLGSDDSKIQV